MTAKELTEVIGIVSDQCPADFGLESPEICREPDCAECWRQAAIKADAAELEQLAGLVNELCETSPAHAEEL